MADDPLDAFDPRFGPGVGRGQPTGEGTRDGTDERLRSLVDSQGPGSSPEDPKVRILRLAVPMLAVAGIFAIGVVFYSGLNTSGTTAHVGDEGDVIAALVDRPRRVCLNDNNPCAWLTVVDGRLKAFNTNGPLAEEYGRLGVSWCASSGYFGSNSTGSQWDQRGRLVEGPSPRSLDEFTLTTTTHGVVVIDFASLTAGRAEAMVDEIMPPDGPLCGEIPFDRDADLDLTR